VIQIIAEETDRKKVVGRTVAIALGIVCIVLSASLIATAASYLQAEDAKTRLTSEVAEKNATITTQTQQITALQTSLSQCSTEVAAKDEDIAELDSYVTSLLNILYLNASTYFLNGETVVMQPNGNVSIFNNIVDYAGFVRVQVASDSNTTFVSAIYSTSYGVNYDEVTVVGTSGIAVFPVLPSAVDIRVGNSEVSSAVNATITATYYY
jgi:type II secretory pathway pseudopilin PulG